MQNWRHVVPSTKLFEFFVRGKNVKITVFSENTNTLYHQLYHKAYEANDDTQVSIPNFACEYAIFEIEFGTIGAGRSPKEIPSMSEPAEKLWYDNVTRKRLFVPKDDPSSNNSLEQI